uniref:Uncharacterized protein n=1 Tax=Rhizophora mucronata TaxID=61149 RepID=A0A2P2N1A2_RHIMU
MIFKAWSETHRGMVIEHPPLFKPSMLCDRSSATEAPAKSVINYAAKARAHAPSLKMATATFKFSNSTIKQCLNEMHDKCPEATPFDFLAALFWIHITRLMAPQPDDHHSLSICLDFRRLVQPSIPLGYFGNALHFSHLSLNVEEMACSDLGKVVKLLHNHVSGITEEEFWSGIDWLKSQKDGEEKYSPPFNMYGPELTCVSMEHMITGNHSLVNAAIFKKKKKPVHVSFHVGNVEGDGLIVVMPSTEEGLARTVSVTLPSNELAELYKDQALLRLEPTMLLCGRT